jgi:glycosyltransferase involved in cell wall biosynthesis
MQRIHEASNVFSSNAHSSIIYGSYIPDTAISRISTTTKLRLGFLGRLAPDKGLDRVFGELASLKGIDFHLEIGGTGNINYVSYLQSLSNKLPVTFLGKVKPETFLSGIDLLIVPSLWNEPAGRVVFEAGICGVPSIVADRGGLPELAGYGNRGWIYDPDNCGELAAIITKICEHKETICDKATQWQLDAHEFDPVKVADKTLAIYNQLIKR